jgi:hypothetical protein
VRWSVSLLLIVGCGGDDDGGGGEDERIDRPADVARLIAGLGEVMGRDNPGAHLGVVVERECGEACACLAPSAAVACPEADGGPAVPSARWNAVALAGAYLAAQVEHAPESLRADLRRAIGAIRIAIPAYAAANAPDVHVASARVIGPEASYVELPHRARPIAGAFDSAVFTERGAVFVVGGALPPSDPLVHDVARRVSAADLHLDTAHALAIDKLSPAERDRYRSIATARPPSAEAAYEVVAVARPSTARQLVAIADPSEPALSLVALAHEAPDGIAIAVARDGKLRELPLVFVKDHAGPSRGLAIEVMKKDDFDWGVERREVQGRLATGIGTSLDGVDLLIEDIDVRTLVELLDDVAVAGVDTVRITVRTDRARALAQRPSVGATRPAIRDTVRRSIGKVKLCYEKQLLANPNIAGKVTVTFTIGTDGRVTAASATGVDPAVSSCVRGVIEKLAFPPNSMPVEVKYPFIFKSGGP